MGINNVFTLWCSRLRSRTVRVVFDFNDSLSDVAPVSPISFPVVVKRNGKNECLFCVFSFLCSHNQDWVQWVKCLISVLHSMMLPLCLQSCSLLVWIERKKEWFADWCLLCVFFLLSLLLRLRAVSVVFDFNDSLNDVAPVSPILFSVDLKINEKSESLMCLFVCIISFVFTTQIEFSECSVWFQYVTQWCCSLVSNSIVCWWKGKRKRKSELSMNDFMRLLCIYYSDWEQWVSCLISIIHSMMLLLCLQHSSL